MESSSAVNEIRTVDSDNVAVREELAENDARPFVIGMFEFGNQNNGITNDEIGITRRQSLLFTAHNIANRRRHGQFDDPQRMPFLVFGLPQYVEVLP